MSAFRSFVVRLRNLFRANAVDRDMAEQMEHHLDLMTEENVMLGMTLEDARNAARRKFGGVEQIKERARDQRSFALVEQFLQDLRHGFRSLRKDRGFTVLAVITLALGIGANTAMFSIVDAVIIRPLPFADPAALAAVWERNPGTGDHNLVSSGSFLDWREQNTSFEELAAFAPITATLRDGATPQVATGARVTAGLLPLLRAQPLIGRAFIDGENAEAGGREILISHALWQTRFAGRPDIVGTVLHLDDTPMTIIGVMAPSFEFPTRDTSFWLALRFDASDRESRQGHQWRVLGRLRPGVGIRSAQADMNLVLSRMTRASPAALTGWGIDVLSYQTDLVGRVRPTLFLVGGMVALVLLVACANVANLMLARSARRQRELAIRGALGAGRGRLVRQLLTESALLAGIGGALGLMLALWVMPFLSSLAPADLPGFSPPGLNLTAIGLALGSLLFATAVVGFAPAWWLSRMELSSFLHGGRTGTGGPGLKRIRNALLVSQLALATMLLVGGGLLVRSMDRLNRVELGFEAKGLIAATVNLPRTRYSTVPSQVAFFDRVREKLTGLPGVAGLGAISDAPLSSSSTFSFVIAGRPRAGSNQREDPVETRAVSPLYFAAVRLPVVEGRAFTDDDREDRPAVAVVNRAFARMHFPDKSAVGERISRTGHGGPWIQIVGVVADVKDQGPEAAAAPAIYVPYVQKGLVNLSALTVVIRTAGAPESLIEEIRRAFTAVDPELPVRRLATIEDIYAAHLASRNFVTRLTLSFAVLTLILGIIGVYGVFSFSVAQRMREFGICLALGAARKDIVLRVVMEGTRLVAIGALAGMAGAIFLSRFLRTLLFEIDALDPLTLVTVAASMVGVSLFALWWPARNAANADPMVALRAE